MTLRIKISVAAGEAHSAVVSTVDDKGEPVSSWAPATVIDPGKESEFFVYQDHNLLISEIPFEEMLPGSTTLSEFAKQNSEFVPPQGTVYVGSQLQ